MTIDQFNAISQKEQVDLVAEQGILLAFRKEGLTMYDLYTIDAFYVEFCYNVAYNYPVKMKIFQDPLELKPYFHNNDLKQLSSILNMSDDVEDEMNPDYFRNEGVLLGERSDGEFKISLYKVDSSYVEHFMHVNNSQQVGIRTFQNTDDINQYINSLYLKLN